MIINIPNSPLIIYKWNDKYFLDWLKLMPPLFPPIDFSKCFRTSF